MLALMSPWHFYEKVWGKKVGRDVPSPPHCFKAGRFQVFPRRSCQHWPWTQLPERVCSPDAEIMSFRKRIRGITSKSAIAEGALELSGPAETTRKPRDQTGDGKHRRPDTATLSWHRISPGLVNAKCRGPLHILSSCSWASHCLQPKRRMKALGQRGRMQTSRSVRAENSWHEKLILINECHGRKWTFLSPSHGLLPGGHQPPQLPEHCTRAEALAEVPSWCSRKYPSVPATPCPTGEAVSSPPTCSLPRVAFFPKSLAC